MYIWLSQYRTESISRYNFFKPGFRRSFKSTKMSSCCQQSFLLYRIYVWPLGLGHTFSKCIFPKRVHQNWHPRLIKLKHLGSSKGFNSTCGFLCFQGYYECIQTLLKKVTHKKISSVVLSLASGFFQLIFKLLLNYMQRLCLFLFYLHVFWS